MSENSQETTYTAESDIDGIQAEIVFTGETGRMLTEFVEATDTEEEEGKRIKLIDDTIGQMLSSFAGRVKHTAPEHVGETLRALVVAYGGCVH